MRCLIRLLLFVGLFLGLASAQTAFVTRNVNLRRDASTDNDPIEKLTPGAQVRLLEPEPTGGFFHVQTAAGNDGFVWGKNIRPTAAIDATATPTGPSTLPPSGQDLFTKLMAARKDAVGQPLVENG